MKAEQLVTVKNAWEPAGLGTAYGEFNGARNYRFQYRDPTAPWAQDARVRRAMIHMLDRQTLADTLIYGMTRPADTLPPMDDPVYALVEQKGLAKYPYDLGRAQQLLAEAGWERASDGAYRSVRGDAPGTPLTVEVRTSSKTDNVREGQALAGEWKAAGLNTSTAVVPDNAANKDELKAIFPGVLGWPIDYTPEALQDWISSQVPNAAGGWRGRNFGGYTNPQYDALYDQLLVSLEAPKRDALYADMLKIVADDAISIFLYYDMQTNTVAHRKGVLGITKTSANQRINAWNIHTWALE
jgi:peptide/nickel transport system substrate-binding protein